MLLKLPYLLIVCSMYLNYLVRVIIMMYLFLLIIVIYLFYFFSYLFTNVLHYYIILLMFHFFLGQEIKQPFIVSVKIFEIVKNGRRYGDVVKETA